MKIQQILYHEGVFAPQKTDEGFVESAVNLVLVFAQRIYFESHPIHVELKKKFANAEIVYCSSAGNIIDNKFVVNKIVINAIAFEKTTIKVAEVTVENSEDSFAAGEEILQQLNTENELKGILFFTDGSRVNGTSFIAGINNKNIHTVGASGGMAGDDANFCRTLVGLNHDPKEGKIVAIGFYGESISFGYSSVGGWKDYGPERIVTSSNKNVVYKIGDYFALDLYKEYLGKYSSELPGSALFFPLSMRENSFDEPVVRTILSIDEETKSMTFAGDIPEGSIVRFMQSNVDNLVNAAAEAAIIVKNQVEQGSALAVLISCVGRRLVLGERVEEELDITKDILGDEYTITGFYSYGEFSPDKINYSGCKLHNQTMTVTLIKEK